MSETDVQTTEGQVVDTDDLDAFANDFFGEKKQAKPAAKPEAEQDDEATGEVDNTEAQKTEADPNEEADAEFVEAPKKKPTVQDRIDELVRQREDAKREAATQLAQVRKEFEDKLAALAPKAPEAKEAGEPTPDDTNEDGTPKYSLGEFDPQYVRDLTKFAFAQERERAVAEATQAAEQVKIVEAQTALTTEWNGKVEAAKVNYPDFQEKGSALLNGFNDLQPDYARYLSTVLMSMDHGPDVLYYLSNNPDEATKIVNSGAQRATLALGRIEAKFIEADQQKQAAKPKVSKAPEPASVRARGTNGAFVSVEGDTDDLDAFSGEFFRKQK